MTSDNSDGNGEEAWVQPNLESWNHWDGPPDPNPRLYSDDSCIAAIRGEAIPPNITNTHWVTRLCVVRGIRHHDGFASELRGMPEYPEFTRALNARDIMSNVILDINKLDEFPYCIWYP